jgi:hypothetical protein
LSRRDKVGPWSLRIEKGGDGFLSLRGQRAFGQTNLPADALGSILAGALGSPLVGTPGLVG